MTHTPPDEARCLDCNYSLRGLESSICPECGRSFDPRDPRTYRDPTRAAKRLLEYFRKPPPPILRLMTVAVTIAALAERSGPGLNMGVFCMVWIPAALFLMVVVAEFIGRVIVVLATHRQGLPRKLTGRLGWLITPACLLLIASAVLYPWPTLVRFQLSRKAFEDAIITSIPPSGRRVGLYWVARVNKYADGCVFFETATDFFDSGGFVYVPPNVQTPGSGEGELTTYAPVSHRWRIAEESW